MTISGLSLIHIAFTCTGRTIRLSSKTQNGPPKKGNFMILLVISAKQKINSEERLCKISRITNVAHKNIVMTWVTFTVLAIELSFINL